MRSEARLEGGRVERKGPWRGGVRRVLMEGGRQHASVHITTSLRPVEAPVEASPSASSSKPISSGMSWHRQLAWHRPGTETTVSWLVGLSRGFSNLPKCALCGGQSNGSRQTLLELLHIHFYPCCHHHRAPPLTESFVSSHSEPIFKIDVQQGMEYHVNHVYLLFSYFFFYP